MKLIDLLCDVEYEVIHGDLGLEVCDIAYDSRKVSEKCVFVALCGFRLDGHDYIDDAIK